MARISSLQTVAKKTDPDSSARRLKNDFLRQLANTAGQLTHLQRENADVRRRMDDVLRCNASLATMLHQQGRLLSEMSHRLEGLQEGKRTWFNRWIEGFRKAA